MLLVDSFSRMVPVNGSGRFKLSELSGSRSYQGLGAIRVSEVQGLGASGSQSLRFSEFEALQAFRSSGIEWAPLSYTQMLVGCYAFYSQPAERAVDP